MDLRLGPFEAAGWLVLGLLLLATLIGALRLDRAELPLLGDEATYAMQAASLAWDLDLTYTRQDYDRFVANWRVPPVGLILQSRPGSERLVYAKPPLYALAIAPFVRLAPVRGPVVANALFLAAAALLAAGSLRHRIGPAAPLWVAAFVFASVAFAYVFWGESDLFLMAAVAAGYALVYRGDRQYASGVAPVPQIYAGEATESGRGFLARWLGAGALLGVAAAYRPVYLALLVPALLAARGAPPRRRGAALGGLVLGALAVVAFSMGLQWLAGGDPTGYGGQRQGIYTGDAFPEVDYPAARWPERVARHGSASWLQAESVAPQLNPKLALWNAVYFLAGRDVGVLPYFLPVVLGFLAFWRDRGRWAIPFAVGLAAAAFLLLRPFNFYGGGALGNRYFLPLYPAIWFMAARPVRTLWVFAVALLASPFLGPLWSHPMAYPIGENGESLHVSRFAQRWLPYETTQSSAPGHEVSVGGGLWVKVLSPNVWSSGRSGRLRIAGDSRGELLVASPQPLDALDVEFDERAPSRLEVAGRGELRPLLLKPNGYVLFEVPLTNARAVHPMWWSSYDYHLYALDFHLPGAPAEPIGFRVLPARDLIHRPAGG
jgi:hypothetical protein